MQRELIEMLEKVVDHVVFCNGHDQRFSSTTYGVDLLKEAGALIEKAKNNAPAVPQEVVLTDDVIADAEKWRALKASNPQLGMSWLGNPFVGFYMGRPANKAWADAINEGLDIDAAIIAALRAKGQ